MKQNKNMVNVEVSFRLVNLDFDGFDEFQLAENILLRKMSSIELNIKYPIKSIYIGLGDLEKQSWENHQIESIINLNIPESELEKVYSVEQTDLYQNLIINLFLYNNYITGSMIYATHCSIRINNNITLCTLGYKGYNFVPNKLNLHQLQKISNTYNILRLINSDVVLSRALNRFYIALKEDLHSPNMVNSPNWDKIVDFVISLESILLSTPDNNKSELTYRFKLNGSSLLWDVTGLDKKIIFEVLGKIYGIRSNIVHGGDDKNIERDIDIILSKLKIDYEKEVEGIGKLMILSNLLENWIRISIEKLANIPLEKRPYKTVGGWEEYIWNN